jgi:L-2-hydroxyglutarate oxidase
VVTLETDVAVVGGGIVGVATAHALLSSEPRPRLVLLEAEDRLAFHQTGHNSGVLHSGLYYKPRSAKAAFCRSGRRKMIAFCEARGVPYAITGKLVVATRPDELPRLDELRARGEANGLAGVRRLSIEEAREIEPSVTGLGALHVPEAGVVDFAAATAALGAAVAELGGEVRTGARLTRVARDGSRVVLETTAGEVRCRVLVACAGLAADRVARLAGLKPTVAVVPFRGDYFALVPERAHLVKTLIYPVPDPRFPFLGVHFTRRVNGLVEVGPNAVVALSRRGYGRFALSCADAFDVATFPGFWRFALKHASTAFDEVRRSFDAGAFTRAAQQLVPEVRTSDLARAGCGIRAQAMTADGGLVDDFLFVEAPGMVHVLNAPSPAATAGLAIGEEIAARVRKQLS